MDALNHQYASLFSQYTCSSDGKRKVAGALCKHLAGRRFDQVVDLGAGDGTLTERLRPLAKSIIAVDRNASFASRLKKRADHVVIGDVREVDVELQNTLYIASYLLQSFSPVHARDFCEALAAKLSSSSALVIVFASSTDSPFQSYYSEACERLGHIPPRSEYGLRECIGRSGLRTMEELRLSTSIFAPTVSDLFARMAFFFRPRLTSYYESSKELMRILQRHCDGESHGDTAIRVEEYVLIAAGKQGALSP